jgi:hypothetical protein
MRSRHLGPALFVGSILAIGWAGCTCSEPLAIPESHTAREAANDPVAAAKEAESRKARLERKEERRKAPRSEFEKYQEITVLSVADAKDGGAAARARALATVQSVAGTPLRWVRKECTSGHLLDTSDGVLRAGGHELWWLDKLTPEACTPPSKARSIASVTFVSADEAVARARFAQLSAAKTDGDLKVKVQARVPGPGEIPAWRIEGKVRLRPSAANAEAMPALAAALLGPALPPAAQLVAVCERSLTVQQWVLEETTPRPASTKQLEKQAAATKGKKNARAAKEHFQRWADMTVWGASADGPAIHAELMVRAAKKKEADPAKKQLRQTVKADLVGAAMLSDVSAPDALYRCGS